MSLPIPDEAKEVIAELRYRVKEANKPDAKWYSLAEIMKEFGMHEGEMT